MTRHEFIAFATPMLIGAAMIFFTTCGHGQPLPVMEWNYRTALIWQLPSPAEPVKNITLSLPTSLVIESSDDLKSWNYYAPAVVTFTTTNDRPSRFFRLIAAPVAKTLAWDASPEAKWFAATYRLHFGPEAGQSAMSVDVGTNLTANVIASGVYAAVTTVADSGVESDFSTWLKL